MKSTIGFLMKTWQEMAPELPMEYQFLDERYKRLYGDEDRFSLTIGYFSFLTLFISCLGLLGLVSFTTQQRTREIGIRKVNGATAEGSAWRSEAIIKSCPAVLSRPIPNR